MTTSLRHRWADPVRFAQKSERDCTRGCGIVKVTFHRGGRHWIEFYRGEEKIEGTHTPVCVPVEEAVHG